MANGWTFQEHCEHMRKVFALTSILLIVSVAESQRQTIERIPSSHEILLTGNARLDLRIVR